MLSAILPWFVKVTVCELVLPTAVLANVTLVGRKDATAPCPMPDRLTS